jgi:cytochrome bd-type quinol oxidase subunit 2
MRKNWPFFIVASFLNAVFITGAFIEFKLHGMDVSSQPTWYEINPFVFTGGIFVISFLVIIGIVILFDLMRTTSKTREITTSREKMSNVQREIRSPLQPATWNL